MKIVDYARTIGIEVCREFNPELLTPLQKIRGYCFEDKCGNYGQNYTCPPFIGTVEENSIKLKGYRRGLILQYSCQLDVRNDLAGVIRTKNYFHQSVLKLEEILQREGIEGIWGMAGGNCGLCEHCEARFRRPCPFPDRARTSLEAIAVDVLALLENLGLDNKFHSDRITWTGCILY